MHENSQKFLRYDGEQKRLILSNHDSEYSLFQIDQHSEILINDDQILKSGQPIKIKVASFEEANKNLYLSINFPIQKSLKDFNKGGKTKTSVLLNQNTINPYFNPKTSNVINIQDSINEEDSPRENDQADGGDDHNNSYESSILLTKQLQADDGNYDKNTKKY